MTVFTRKRVRAGAFVAAFVAAFAGIGAVSRSNPAVAGVPLPSATWYWTMAVSPSDPDVVVLGASTGLYRSSDGGKTWAPTGPKGVNATSLVQVGSSIFAGGVPLAPTASPVIRKGSTRAASDGHSVLAASTDGGKTWQELHPRGLPNVSVQALAIDPANSDPANSDPANSTALYALLNTGKLYRSTDGARSFQLVSSKLGVPPFALGITQDSHFVAGDMDTGSYVSTNGKAWRRTAFKDSRGGRMVMEYAVQPTDSTRVLMTAFGIQISTDSGKTWHTALKSNVMFGPVAWAPSTSGVAYAVGFDSSVWRTDDGGKTWKKVA